MKTQLDRIEIFHAGETDQEFTVWKLNFVESPENMKMKIKEGLQNWMVGFVEMINENRNMNEESSIMQRSYADVAKGSGMSDTKQ